MSRRKKRRRRSAKPGSDPSKQWIYFMINFPLIFVTKVGISRDRRTLLQRWSDVDSENFGFDIPVFTIKVFAARWIETQNLRIGSSLRMKINIFGGTGRTERFFILGAIPALIMALISFVIEWSIKIGFIVFCIYTIKNLPEQ